MRKFTVLLAMLAIFAPQGVGANTDCSGSDACFDSERVIDSAELGSAGWYLAELRIPKDVTPRIVVSGSLDPSWRYQWASATLFDADGYVRSIPRVWRNADDGVRLNVRDGAHLELVPGFPGGEGNEVNGLQSITAPRTGRFHLLVSIAADAPISDLSVTVTQSIAAPQSKRIDLFDSWKGNDIQALWPTQSSLELTPGGTVAAEGTMTFDDRLFVQSDFASTAVTVIDSPSGQWTRVGGFVLDGGPAGTYGFSRSHVGALESPAVVGVDLPAALPHF
jgi:hypothetical protein